MSLPGTKSQAEHFAGFDIHDVTYHSVNNQSIDLSIIIPKNLPKGPRPIIARFHGGGLISGARLYPGFFQSWILEYAAAHSAIIVTPDHRLLPECRGLDILSDVTDFWTWLLGSFSAYISTHIHGLEADLSKIVCVGESAGGWLAVQSAFMRPKEIKATIAVFPMVDLRDKHFTEKYDKVILGVPMLDEELIDEYIAKAKNKPEIICTAATPPDRLDLMIAVFQHGRFTEMFGEERELYPFERLEDLSREGVQLPPLLVTHGTEDSAVPVEGSKKFVEAWKTLQPQARVELVLRPGDHGFDKEATIEDGWLKESLAFVTNNWLGEQ